MRSDLTPNLRAAVIAGNADGVHALLRAGADANALVMPSVSWSALHLAVALLAHEIAQYRGGVADRRRIVDLLLDHGADIWLRDRLGRNAGAVAAGLATTMLGRLRARIAAETEPHFHHDFFNVNGTPVYSGGIPRFNSVPGRMAA